MPTTDHEEVVIDQIGTLIEPVQTGLAYNNHNRGCALGPAMTTTALQIGQLYWVPDSDAGWIRAKLQRITEIEIYLEMIGNAAERVLSLDQSATLIAAGADSGDLINVDDLTELDRISIASLLATLRARFEENRIYTYAGLTLVSLNPFKPLPDQYGPERMAAFLEDNRDHPPHIYAVAQRCRQNLIELEQPQSLIICGDSGAGKTEAAKYALQYLVHLSALSAESDQVRAGTSIRHDA